MEVRGIPQDGQALRYRATGESDWKPGRWTNLQGIVDENGAPVAAGTGVYEWDTAPLEAGRVAKPEYYVSIDTLEAAIAREERQYKNCVDCLRYDEADRVADMVQMLRELHEFRVEDIARLEAE